MNKNTRPGAYEIPSYQIALLWLRRQKDAAAQCTFNLKEITRWRLRS